MTIVIISFAVTALAFTALLCTLLKRKYRKYYVPVKMINSGWFLINLGIMTEVSGNYEPLKYLLPGFILCFAGDYFLGLHNRYIRHRFLMIGTVLFLLGHVCFIAYLYTLAPLSPYDFILPVIGIAAVLILRKIPSYFLGKFAYAGMVYAVFVCGMAGKAIEAFVLMRDCKSLCLALGGLLFLTSDVLIAPLYFKRKRAWAVHGLNVGTYYLAMFMLAVSVVF